MHKQPTNNNSTSTSNVPLGAGVGATTASGVTVITSDPINYNAPLPPSYEQATGNATAFTTTTRTYATTSGWNGLQMGAPTSQTQYTTYVPPPGNHQPQVVVIQQQPMLGLGPEPVYITCPACHIQKLTRIEYEPSTRTHLMAAILCLVGLWCCVCLPYCAGSCMNTHHYCGNCDKFLGTYGSSL